MRDEFGFEQGLECVPEPVFERGLDVVSRLDVVVRDAACLIWPLDSMDTMDVEPPKGNPYGIGN